MKHFLLSCAALLAAVFSASAEPLLGLTGTNQLVVFDSAMPSAVGVPVTITGLQASEKIVGIDFRPRTGQLYGVGIVSGATDTVRLYQIDADTGAAALIPGASSFAVTTGVRYGTDFNPTTDRIRVVNSGDENFRINPNNGARADTPTNDTDLSPAGQSIDAVAYDRNFDSGLAVANRTTLYGISRTQNRLVLIGGVNQSPSPNGGAVTAAGIGSLGATISTAGGVGFDISAFTGAAYGAWTDNADAHTKLYTISLISGAATLVGTIGDGSLALESIAVVPSMRLAFGPEGSRVTVNSVNLGEEQLTSTLTAFGKPHKGGVRVALGDLNHDGVADYVVAAGKGSPPLVRAFDGHTGALLFEFNAFDPAFRGGVYVAVGDVNADGTGDIVTAPGAGFAAEVRIFSGASGAQMNSFPVFVNFTGGVTVAAADLNNDGGAEIVVGSGPGLPPEVRVFNSAGTVVQADFQPYPANLANRGVIVAAGIRRTATSASGPMIVTALGKNSGEFKIFNSPTASPFAFTEERAVKAFNGSNPGGLRLACLDTNLDGLADIVAVPGPGRSAAQARIFSGTDGTLLRAAAGVFSNGGFVAAGR